MNTIPIILLLLPSIVASLECSNTCIANPKDAACADCKYNASDDIDMTCDMMKTHFSLPCAVRDSCKSDPMCSTFRLLATICSENDNMSMGCENYEKLCTKGSLVKQCLEEPPLKSLEKTKSVITEAVAMCSGMMKSMIPSCNDCKDEKCLNPLDVLGDGCNMMPSMKSCTTTSFLGTVCEENSSVQNLFAKYCPRSSNSNSNAKSDSSPSTEFCSSTGMVMGMDGFQWTAQGDPCIIYLFKGLILRTRLSFWFAVFISFLLGLSNHALFGMRRLVSSNVRDALMPYYLKSESRRNGRSRSVSGGTGGSSENASAVGNERNRTLQLNSLFWETLLMVVYLSHVSVGYAMMLVVMTFRYEFLLAVIIGLGLGNVLDTRLKLRRVVQLAVESVENKGQVPSSGVVDVDLCSGPTPCCDGAGDDGSMSSPYVAALAAAREIHNEEGSGGRRNSELSSAPSSLTQRLLV
eukprot:g5059.t1